MGTVSPEARREMITKKAFELFVNRGSEPGHELEDWLAAEKIVDRELQKTQTSGSQPAPSRPATAPPAHTQTAPPKTTPTPKQQTPTPIRPTKVAGYKKPR